MKARETSAVDEALVARLAEAVGLTLTADQLPEVTANLRRAAALAESIMAVPLENTQEFGPTWRP